MEQVVNMATQLRPKNFSDMVGQPYAKGLGKQIGKGIVSGQGYMLIGPKGCGKTSLARIVAKSLNCSNRDTDTGNPCNECSSCVQYNTGVHRTIKEINAASYRGIGDMREKLSDIHKAIPEGYKRVYIIDEAHLLSTEAFSYFLKPLEEHSDNIIFIFTTTNPEKVLDTIVSRLSQIPIKELSSEDLTTIVKNAVSKGVESGVEDWKNITDADIEQAVLSASGSPRQAITNISGIVYHGVHPTISTDTVDPIVEKFISGSTAGVLSLCSAILSDKTSDPSSLITMIINKLFSRIGDGTSNEVGVLARQIADLSQVLDVVTSSTPAVITAAKIAACVPQKTPPASTPATTKSKKKINTPKIKMTQPEEQGILRNGDGKIIVDKSSMQDIFDVIATSKEAKKYLSKKWMDILDNPDTSDIVIHDGVLVIAVENPDSTLYAGLSEIFDKVKVEKLTENGTEPPF